MSEHAEQENPLDGRLRDVAVPDELVERLGAIAACDDAELDWRLRAVAVPDDWIERLLAAIDDAALDAALCDVVVPMRVVPRGRILPKLRSRSRIGEAAWAAALLLMISATYLGGLISLIHSRRPLEPDPRALIVIDRGPLDLLSPTATAATILLTMSPDGQLELADVGGDDGGGQAGRVRHIARDQELADDDKDPLRPTLNRFEPLSPGPAGSLAREMGTEWDPMANWLLARWGLYGSPQAAHDSLPILRAAAEIRIVGIEPPLARGFDREFALLRGVHPPVSLAAAPSLALAEPPLTTTRTSFEAAREAVAAGGLPDPAAIRIEDFLAAVDYPFLPAEPDRLAIRTAAGPAYFNPTAAGLLQIGVSAGPPSRRSLPQTHLTVALDISDSMAADGRLAAVRESLRRFIRWLAPDDRMSVLLFRESAATIIDQASAEQSIELLRAFDRLESQRLAGRGTLEWPTAWQAAVSQALDAESESAVARRLVLVTDSGPQFTEPIRSRVIEMTAAAAARGLKIEIVDASGRSEPAALFQELAAVGGGGAHAARATDDLVWRLAETLTGDSTLAAQDARLQVRFRPQAVAAYRRIGHETDSLGGWSATTPTAELHFGEQATALFEVWLLPNGEDDVAEATLEWLDPRTGDWKKARPQRISRVQFAASLAASPLSLQAAAIAAETAGVLRQSFDFSINSPTTYSYWPKPRDLDHVARAARLINPQLREREDFQRFLHFVEDADRRLRDRRTETAKAGMRGMQGGRWQEGRN